MGHVKDLIAAPFARGSDFRAAEGCPSGNEQLHQLESASFPGRQQGAFRVCAVVQEHRCDVYPHANWVALTLWRVAISGYAAKDRRDQRI